MTLPPEDDRPLTDFLKHHRPIPPPAAPGLEDRLMAKIGRASTQRRSRPGVWLLPPAIAASLVAGLLSYRTLAPAQLSASEAANLESFLESNWQNTVTDTPETTFLPSDPTQN